MRGPVFDATHSAMSPIQLSLQFYSALLSVGDGRRPHVLKLYRDLSGGFGVYYKFIDVLRIVVATASVSMMWRHTRHFKRSPFRLDRIIDQQQARGDRLHEVVVLEPA